MQTKETDTIKIVATGNAIAKACIVAEIIKHRIYNLHQVNTIETIEITDEYEPIEEGLDNVSIERNLAVLQILLTTKEPEDTTQIGYQAPLSEDHVIEWVRPERTKREPQDKRDHEDEEEDEDKPKRKRRRRRRDSSQEKSEEKPVSRSRRKRSTSNHTLLATIILTHHRAQAPERLLHRALRALR